MNEAGGNAEPSPPTSPADSQPSASLFAAGWRPAIGWVCAVALALYYWPAFVIGQGLWIWASLHAEALQPRPDMGIGDILGLLGSLLGLGTLRTVEKLQGVARSGFK